MSELNLSGNPSFFSEKFFSGQEGRLSDIDSFLETRLLDSWYITIGLYPIGKRVNDFLTVGYINYIITEGKVAHIETREGFYIYIQNKYMIKEIGRRDLLIDLYSIKSILELITDDELFLLSTKEAEWFASVLKDKGVRVIGSSVFIPIDKNGYIKYMEDIYKTTLVSSELNNGLKLNFTSNRRNAKYTDPGILALTILNFKSGYCHKIDGL